MIPKLNKTEIEEAIVKIDLADLRTISLGELESWRHCKKVSRVLNEE